MDVELIVGLAALAIGIVCVISGIYIWRIYGEIKKKPDAKDALFLRRLVARNIRVAAASGVVSLLVVNSYLGSGPLPRPWGALILGACLLVYMTGPIGDALLWRKERRRT